MMIEMIKTSSYGYELIETTGIKVVAEIFCACCIVIITNGPRGIDYHRCVDSVEYFTAYV